MDEFAAAPSLATIAVKRQGRSSVFFRTIS
jgi:hypothetical protein